MLQYVRTSSRYRNLLVNMDYGHTNFKFPRLTQVKQQANRDLQNAISKLKFDALLNGAQIFPKCLQEI